MTKMERTLEDAEELKTRISFWAATSMTVRAFYSTQERLAKLNEFKQIIEKNKWNPNHKKALIKFWEEHMAMLIAKRLEGT